jgi:cytochrome P450
LFTDDIEVAIDELLTIFFAGSQTSANVTQNLMMYLCKNPEYKIKILDELKK